MLFSVISTPKAEDLLWLDIPLESALDILVLSHVFVFLKANSAIAFEVWYV